MAKSYYRVIDGERYDREMLEIAEEAVAGESDGSISVDAAKKLFEAIIDGNTVTEIEQKTLEYIRENFSFTEAAEQWLIKEIEDWNEKHGGEEKAEKPKASKYTSAPTKKIRQKTKVVYVTKPQRKTRHDPSGGGARGVETTSIFWKVLAFVLVLLIGAAFFFGRMLAPVREDPSRLAQISELETKLASSNQELSRMETRVDILKKQLEAAAEDEEEEEAAGKAEEEDTRIKRENTEAEEPATARESGEKQQSERLQETKEAEIREEPAAKQLAIREESTISREEFSNSREGATISREGAKRTETQSAEEKTPEPVVKIEERIVRIEDESLKIRRRIESAIEEKMAGQLAQGSIQFDRENLVFYLIPSKPYFSGGYAVPTPALKQRLRDFFPKLVNTLAPLGSDVREIRFQGHSSSIWRNADNRTEAYLKNLGLSTKRAEAAIEYCFDLKAVRQHREWLMDRLVSVGLSSRKPVLNRNNVEDPVLSRRISIAITPSSVP